MCSLSNTLKQTLLGGLFLFLIHTSNAQRAVPTAYSNTVKINSVRTWDARAPEDNIANLKTRPLRDVQQTTQYFDGLGRPLQTVVKQGSYPTGGIAVDMISMVEYDAFGREPFTYLPTPAKDSMSLNDGRFKLNPFAQQAIFYGSTGSPINGQGETFFYGETRFEASPLNRITETGAPGNSWTGTMHNNTTNETTRRSVKTKYYPNTATDAVRIWKATHVSALGDWGTYAVDGTLGTNGIYNAGTLYKTVIIDEHNKQVIEFKDKQGNIILKKIQADGTADDNGSGAAHTGWMCTYYIYDDFGNLRCVVQPEGVKALEANGWQFTTTILNHQCFRYEYDQRQRLIMKKVPGVLEADAVWMVYDMRDRLVMTQDAKQRAYSNKAWIVTHYDNLNRPIQTGYYTNNHVTIKNKTFQQILADAADQIDYPFAATAIPGASYYSTLTMTGYDNYDGMSAAGFSSSLTKNIDNAYTGSTYLHTTYNTSPLYAQQPLQSFQTQGLVTWTKVKLSSVNYFEYRVNIYDDKGRMIQQKHRNYTGGTSVTTTQYNWAGQPLRIVHRHHKLGNTAQASISITDMTYDDLGRLTLTQKKLRNNLYNSNALPGEWTTIAENRYDALGQLTTKKLGKKRNSDGTYSSNALATLDYTYNIRGWLLAINKEYINNTDADRYFAMQLGYDKDPGMSSGGTKQYNGNISSILWKSAGDQQRRKYNFTYDAANRLMGAAFGQYVSGAGASAVFNTSAGVDFSVNGLGYDYNGNITGMTQYGLKLNASAPIDKLIYTYETGSNRLQKVTEHPDIATDKNGKLGDFKDGGNTDGSADYDYNGNGSLIMDKNKGITSISYHSGMELPKLITTANGTIEYMYNYLNEKNWKKTIDNSITGKTITTTTNYIENYVYESKSISPVETENPDYKDKLQFAAHEEGRIRPLYGDATNTTKITGFVYDYFIKDHLGNVRTVLTDELKEDPYPMATMETAQLATEEKYYANISTTKTVKPAGYPTDATTNPNDYVAKVNGSGNKIGPSILLKVMAGDRLNIAVSSWYKKNGASPGNPTSLLTSLVAALAGGVSNAAPVHGSAAQLTSSGALDPAAMDFLNSRSAVTGGKPKAALNWIFLDEQLKFSSANGAYGTDEVGGDNEATVKQHARNDISIKKNGYFFVYVSNETPNIDVFFDNLRVLHKRSAILEESSYYPFGLTMAGISSKALAFGEPGNKYKFNDGSELQNKEFADGSGLEWYATDFRGYDAQIGRFHQVDPLGELTEDWSGYSYALNSPLLYNDPLGLISDRVGQDITGWIDPGNGGDIYFDPNVHSQDDLPEGAGTYLGEEIILTDQNGNPLGFGDDQGNIIGNMPTGTNLPEIVINGRTSKTNGTIVGSFLEGVAHNIASSVVYTTTAVGSSVYNGINEAGHRIVNDIRNGQWPNLEGNDTRYYTGRTFKLQNWQLKIVIDPQKGKQTMTNEESNELALSTVNAVMLPIQVVPAVNVSKSVVINATASWARNTAVKEAVKAPVRILLKQ